MKTIANWLNKEIEMSKREIAAYSLLLTAVGFLATLAVMSSLRL